MPNDFAKNFYKRLLDPGVPTGQGLVIKPAPQENTMLFKRIIIECIGELKKSAQGVICHG